jgi:hypothetical protein
MSGRRREPASRAWNRALASASRSQRRDAKKL